MVRSEFAVLLFPLGQQRVEALQFVVQRHAVDAQVRRQELLARDVFRQHPLDLAHHLQLHAQLRELVVIPRHLAHEQAGFRAQFHRDIAGFESLHVLLHLAQFFGDDREPFIDQSYSADDKARFEQALTQLPQHLQDEVQALRRRVTDHDRLDRLIVALCQNGPCTKDDLALLLGKREDYLRTKYINGLLRDGRLNYLYPEVLNHPQQAYVATGK